jgi:bifunctional non-homologous end joining protein LigD
VPLTADKMADKLADAVADPLQRYRDKRDFGKTPEPKGARAKAGQQLSFVIQKHDATRLHYDFRLELDGVLLSWAIPKGPSFDPADKRMAVRTEDHPLSYGSFEGTIPAGQYGAGEVIVWDRGTWQPVGDPHAGLRAGKLAFRLAGEKVVGQWELVRMHNAHDRKETWLLIKKRDADARPHAEFDVVSEMPDSVLAKPKRSPAAKPAPAKSVDSLAQAKKARVPKELAPQLATLATNIPTEGQWVYEVKFDGYRLLTRYEKGVPRLYTRNGHDWTDKMPRLAKELATLRLDSGWIDGEVVALDSQGVPNFNALQNAFDRSDTQALTYFVFDVPFFEGHDLRELPLTARRDLLEKWLAGHAGEHVRFSTAFDADPASVLSSACRMNLEGLIAKRADAPYRSERSTSWLKLKCHQRQEFVVGGFVDRTNATGEIGSLLLGVHDDQGRLMPVGGVGTGWDAAAARDLHRRLSRIEASESPFAQALPAAKHSRWSRRTEGGERWVKPQLVVEVAFGGWTAAGQIRHASFLGVRSDKPASAITRESAVNPSSGERRHSTGKAATAVPRASAKKTSSAVARRNTGKADAGMPAITHPERVIDTSTGLTKLDLARYYDSVADWMLPHLSGRPVALLRGPSGIAGTLFFQKHAAKTVIPGIRVLDASLWPGHDPLLEIATREALLGAAQMNVIEFHTWNSTVRNMEKPDRIVFDLDPGEGVTWAQIREGAVLVRSLLQQLELESWLKTSGGKGLHVVVPIAPRWHVDKVRSLSQAVVVHLAKTIPERFVAKSGASNRVGKIFVDYLRNGDGATTVAAFSARARPGLGVSMPIAWEQLDSLKSSGQWTIATARDYLSLQKADPWSAYGAAKQSLREAIRVLKVGGAEK